MGSTFSALYIRNASLRTIANLASEGMKKGGFILQSDPTPNASVRNIVLMEKDGWVLFADEGLEFARASDEASRFSSEFDTDVLEIAVDDSDRAWLVLYTKGKLAGSLEIPKDAPLDQEGHRIIRADFLKHLATSGAKESIVEGIRCNDTFVEESLAKLLVHVGLTLPLTGANYLLEDRDTSATYLAFQLPQTAPIARPIAVSAPDLTINMYSVETELFVGHTFEYGFSVGNSGGAVSGIEVELSGQGVALLSDVEIQAEKHGKPQNHRSKVTEFKGTIRTSRKRLTASIPGVQVGYAENPLVAILSSPVKSARTMKQAFEEQSEAGCYVRMRMTGARIGLARIAIRVRPLSCSDGSVEHPEMTLNVRPAPRLPVLPAKTNPRSAFQHSNDDFHYCRTLANYAGVDHAVGWIAFEGSFESCREHLLNFISLLADAALAAHNRAKLEVRLTSAGAHPRGKPNYVMGDDLNSKGWRGTFDRIANEGVARFSYPIRDRDIESPEITLFLSHQPRGDTEIDATQKRKYARIGMTLARPTEFAWSIPRGPRESDAKIATVIDEVMKDAVSINTILSGYAGASAFGNFSRASQRTPFEELMNLRDDTSLLLWCKEHIRTPAWRVIVRKKLAALLGKAPKGISLQTEQNAVLVRSVAADPFSMKPENFEALERFLLPCVGTEKDWKAYERAMSRLADREAKKFGVK
jgi:hypothetical protein